MISVEAKGCVSSDEVSRRRRTVTKAHTEDARLCLANAGVGRSEVGPMIRSLSVEQLT